MRATADDRKTSRVASATLGQLLLQGFRWFDSALLQALARGWPHLRHSHSLVMVHLSKTGTRPVEIARRLDVSRQAVHQTVRELQEMGLVELVPDPDDGRGQLVTLTTEGHANVRDAKFSSRGLRKSSLVESDEGASTTSEWPLRLTGGRRRNVSAVLPSERLRFASSPSEPRTVAKGSYSLLVRSPGKGWGLTVTCDSKG